MTPPTSLPPPPPATPSAWDGEQTGPARPPIRLLPPEVAARIAAGEVIERPASVVKELLENALDAGARSIEIAVEGGGADRIRVRDDGCGIPAAQLADAFERHATSKLRDEHDLFAVRTLGFRGEALAAIVAAGEVDVTTRPAAEPAAATVRYRGGHLDRAGSAAAAPGTAIEVRDLFGALPARRRFLRSPQVEARAVVQAAGAYALAYPQVAFRVTVDGRAALVTTGDGVLATAFAAVCGEAAAETLLPLRAARTSEEGGVAVEGVVGAPSVHRASRRTLFLFVNGRAITSRPLTHAIEEAYHALLPSGRHPVGLVHVHVPPDEVDVNVHPTKAEVRFRHERLVYATVSAAVRAALTGAPAPALAQGGVAPEWAAGRMVVAGARPAGMSATASSQVALRGSPRFAGGPLEAPNIVRDAAGAVARPEGGHGEMATAGTTPGQTRLALHARLPALRALGQVDATYLVAEAPDGLYLVDQHAAHERVLYERVLAARAAARPAVQPLLTPVVCTLAPIAAALLEEQAELLAAFGFEVERVDGTAVIVRALPAALAAQDPERALVAYLDRSERESGLSGPDRVAASIACRGAVMAGDRLDIEQQRALLRALEGTETPQTCPHGRPTLLHLSTDALARSFGRR